MSLYRRPKREDSGQGLALEPVPELEGYWADFCNVQEFISRTRWPDGSLREPGTLLLFTQDGYWKCCCSDKDQQMVAFASSDSLQGLLQVVEEGLGKEKGLDWRPQKKLPSKR